MIRTTAQNARLHQLITTLGLENMKPELAHSASHGRTSSTADLSKEECQWLISDLTQRLNGSKPSDASYPDEQSESEIKQKLRRKVLSVCHQLGWYKKDESGNIKLRNQKPILDMYRLDNFCQAKSHAKKPFNDQNKTELQKLVYQFDEMLKNYVKKHTT